MSEQKHINKYEAPTLYNEAGSPLIASRGFEVVKYEEHRAAVEKLIAENDRISHALSNADNRNNEMEALLREIIVDYDERNRAWPSMPDRQHRVRVIENARQALEGK
jgi:hypothetical protein